MTHFSWVQTNGRTNDNDPFEATFPKTSKRVLNRWLFVRIRKKMLLLNQIPFQVLGKDPPQNPFRDVDWSCRIWSRYTWFSVKLAKTPFWAPSSHENLRGARAGWREKCQPALPWCKLTACIALLGRECRVWKSLPPRLRPSSSLKKGLRNGFSAVSHLIMSIVAVLR